MTAFLKRRNTTQPETGRINHKKKIRSASITKTKLYLILTVSFLFYCWIYFSFSFHRQNNHEFSSHFNNPIIQEISSTVRSQTKKKKKLLFVIGAGRSGTSTLTGLFITSNIYYGGNQLKPASVYNTKGYFEDEDMVKQNKFLVEDQKFREFLPLKFPFNHSLAIAKIQSEPEYFTNGRNFVKRLDRFVENQDGDPHETFIVKDPLLSITLSTWLDMLSDKPVVLFTHRHPVDVARSLRKRNSNIISNQGLMYSIGYNRNSIQTAVEGDLCLVSTSYYNIMNDSLEEVQRIVKELKMKCDVVPSIPYSSITQSLVDGFVDHGLRHDFEKPKGLENECELDDWGLSFYRAAKLVDPNVHNGIFFVALKIYCDIENGNAFEKDYAWPEVQKMKRKE